MHLTSVGGTGGTGVPLHVLKGSIPRVESLWLVLPGMCMVILDLRVGSCRRFVHV